MNFVVINSQIGFLFIYLLISQQRDTVSSGFSSKLSQ